MQAMAQGVGLYQLQTEQFSGNLQLNLQQLTSKVRGKVMEGSHVGKQAAPVDYLAPISMRTPAGRNALVQVVENNYSRRWVTPVDKETVQRINTFDKLRTIEDPQNELVRGAAAAVAREWDDRVIAAAFATAQISNTDGTTLVSETWATAQNGLTGSNYGLTVLDTYGNGSTTIGMTQDKMIEAKQLFRHYHVTDAEMMPGDLTMVIGSQQEADMLKLVEVVSTEFNRDEILKTGRIDGFRFLDWNFVLSERLQSGTGPSTSNANCRSCIALVKTGLYLGLWLDVENLITRETLISGAPWQIMTMMSSGATRLEPGRVVEVVCGNDTQGADNV
jgi:hypothetical protein